MFDEMIEAAEKTKAGKQYRLRYETGELPEGSWHQWAAIANDRSFAVIIWCRLTVYTHVDNEIDCGVERHRKPTGDEKPNHELCPFLLGPCCHDGSGLHFREWYERKCREAFEDHRKLRVMRYVAEEFEQSMDV